ncbi:MAG: GMC family oxidoreductase, partial [Ilumatobacteraceae bacterium]
GDGPSRADLMAESGRPMGRVLAMRRRYDIVIVGAGPAGCVLAGRLTGAGGKKVLLIEAGPDHAPESVDAASFFEPLAEPGRTYPNFRVQWTTGAQPRPYRLGRGLGGGSAVSAMIATPGSPGDYDRWERELGCQGWGWNEMRRTLNGHDLAISQPSRQEWGSVDRALVDAAKELGHEPCPTYLSHDELGVGPAWLTRWDGRRSVASAAYIPRASRALKVRADTVVDRVILDGRDAVGVLTVGGELIEAGEVIVCAGAIHSPAILLRSGVQRPGIGHGLKDHPSARLSMRLREPNDPFALASATLLRWSSSRGDGDLQMLPLNHFGRDGSAADARLGGLLAAVMSVHSNGLVALTSEDPLVAPSVQLNLLDDERDRARMREAARHMARLAATAAFRRIADEVFIDDEGTPLAALAESDAGLDRWLVANVGDTFHAACTCRMGRIGDESAVVDTAGLVHGYRNLRVCDASIFPDLPRANPALPTVMVAERIASMITSGA